MTVTDLTQYKTARGVVAPSDDRLVYTAARSLIAGLSKDEVLDLLFVYHPSTVQDNLGFTPKETNTPVMPPDIRQRLAYIRSSGDDSNSVYARNNEDLTRYKAESRSSSLIPVVAASILVLATIAFACVAVFVLLAVS